MLMFYCTNSYFCAKLKAHELNQSILPAQLRLAGGIYNLPDTGRMGARSACSGQRNEVLIWKMQLWRKALNG